MSKFKAFILLLLFTSFILAGKVVPLPEIKKPENIIVDQNQILITEFPHVYIYSLKDFKLINKFGKAGEGPREFFRYIRIQPHLNYPDNIVVNSHMKISFFTRDGTFVKEIRSKTSSIANVYKPMGKGKYAAYGLVQENRIFYSTVELYDSNLKKIKEVIRWERPIQQGKSIDPTDYDLHGGEFRVYDGKIVVLIREKGNIEVFDEDGKKCSSVNYDYERIPITLEDKQEFHHFYQTDPRYRQSYEEVKSRFKFNNFFPCARVLTVADNKLYVLTNKRKEKKSEFVIFDLKGKFLKKIMVTFENANIREAYPFTINYGKLFQLVDNEDMEEWELHIHQIQ